MEYVMKNEIEILWDFDQIKGCSLVGYIECAKCELESVFGRAGSEINFEEGGFDDPKVQYEWWLRINETKLTIYDYKEDRPIADHDIEKQNEPILGANDGGSGVGLLLEIARQFSIKEPKIGVDIIFFDAEDYGQPDQSEFAKN